MGWVPQRASCGRTAPLVISRKAEAVNVGIEVWDGHGCADDICQQGSPKWTGLVEGPSSPTGTLPYVRACEPGGDAGYERRREAGA